MSNQCLWQFLEIKKNRVFNMPDFFKFVFKRLNRILMVLLFYYKIFGASTMVLLTEMMMMNI